MTSSSSSQHKSTKQLFCQLAVANPKQRYSQMSSSTSKEPPLAVPAPILNSTLTHSSHAYCTLHKQKVYVSKKDLKSRSVHRQTQESLGRTPFEDRKICQKEKSNKILEKILAKSKQKQVLKHSQQEWMIVRELSHLKTEQQKEAQQIRETDISLQQQTQEPFQRYSQNHSEIFDSNFMINSWIFPSSHFQSAQKKIKNKKMTLKQLWRTKGQSSKPCFNETLKSFNGENHRTIHAVQRQNMKEMILRKGGNLTKCQTQPVEQVENDQNYSIHSRKTKKAGKMLKYLQKETGSALKIQPYQLQHSQKQIKNQSLYNSFSESKIKLVKDPKCQVWKYRSTKHFKRQLTDQQIVVKEISAWEIPNDFSERETFI